MMDEFSSLLISAFHFEPSFCPSFLFRQVSLGPLSTFGQVSATIVTILRHLASDRTVPARYTYTFWVGACDHQHPVVHDLSFFKGLFIARV